MNTKTVVEGASGSMSSRKVLAAQAGAGRSRQLYRRVLIALEFAPAAEPLFEHGLQIAGENGAELLVAHAECLPNTLSFLPAANYEQWNVQTKADTRQHVKALLERARQAGVHSHALALTGPADDAILYAAQKLGVDLIVVGTHGRRGVSRLLSGSVAARVVAHAPCSVLVVRLAAE